MERYIYSKDDELGTETITVRVGTGDKTKDFTVHEKGIRAASMFVENAPKGPWLETASRTILLPGFSPAAFDKYHRWLLTGRLYSKSGLSSTIRDRQEHHHIVDSSNRLQNMRRLYDEFCSLCRLSVLGHYLLDTTLTDTVNDAIVSCSIEYREAGGRFPIRAASETYKTLPITSPTQSLLSDIAAWTVTGDMLASYRKCMEETSSDLCPNFCMDVLVAMAQRFTSTLTPKSPFEDWETSCKYHSHGDEKPCHREKLKSLNASQKKRPASDGDEASAAKRQK